VWKLEKAYENPAKKIELCYDFDANWCDVSNQKVTFDLSVSKVVRF
jgi:hypothetical protein